MGIYFIAAGTSSKNRKKSLDKGFKLADFKPYMPENEYQKLKNMYSNGDTVYVWGANKGSLHHLSKVRQGENVVDVKNKEVMNIFEFCFYYKSPDTNLQEFIGWDEEKPVSKRRPYRYPFFLKSPQSPDRNQKSFFARAFDQEHNQNWLVGQRYFSDREVNEAMDRVDCKSVEELIGISITQNRKNPNTVEKETLVSEPKKKYKQENQSNNKAVQKKTGLWQWLLSFFRRS